MTFLPYTGEGCSLLLGFEILQEDNYFPRYTTFTRKTANSAQGTSEGTHYRQHHSTHSITLNDGVFKFIDIRTI